MHFMSLISQANKSSTHRDNIVIRMGRKDYTSFLSWFRTLWALAIIRIGFSTWPTGDGMLDKVKNLDVYIIYRTFLSCELSHPVIIIIFFCQLKNRFLKCLGQPNNRFLDRFFLPLAIFC